LTRIIVVFIFHFSIYSQVDPGLTARGRSFGIPELTFTLFCLTHMFTWWLQSHRYNYNPCMFIFI